MRGLILMRYLFTPNKIYTYVHSCIIRLSCHVNYTFRKSTIVNIILHCIYALFTHTLFHLVWLAYGDSMLIFSILRIFNAQALMHTWRRAEHRMPAAPKQARSACPKSPNFPILHAVHAPNIQTRVGSGSIETLHPLFFSRAVRGGPWIYHIRFFARKKRVMQIVV